MSGRFAGLASVLYTPKARERCLAGFLCCLRCCRMSEMTLCNAYTSKAQLRALLILKGSYLRYTCTRRTPAQHSTNLPAVCNDSRILLCNRWRGLCFQIWQRCSACFLDCQVTNNCEWQTTYHLALYSTLQWSELGKTVQSFILISWQLRNISFYSSNLRKLLADERRALRTNVDEELPAAARLKADMSVIDHGIDTSPITSPENLAYTRYPNLKKLLSRPSGALTFVL
jgi:hypothetical protein